PARLPPAQGGRDPAHADRARSSAAGDLAARARADPDQPARQRAGRRRGHRPPGRPGARPGGRRESALRHRRGRGQRIGRRQGPPQPAVRVVLHNQGRGTGDRPRPRGQPRDRPHLGRRSRAARRARDVERTGRHGLPPDAPGLAGAVTTPRSVVALASFIATVATAFGARAADAPEGTAGPTTVTLTPARPKLLLGSDTQVDVTLDVRGPESETFAPVRALANVGTLETPHAAGAPGHFTARYLPPPERYPQVALLVVELASGARRMHVVARIALEGSTVVPFHTSPGAAVTMRVGDRNFGPVTADAKGRVEIPILVPPGVRAGIARAVDHNGATRETEVDLQLAPFVRMVVLAPPALDVGSFSEIVVVAVEADGAPVKPTRLALSASGGLLHPLGRGPLGEARFLFEAPRLLGSGAVALTAIAAGTPPSRTDMAVALRVGAPARLAIAPSSHRLIVGSGESARVAVSAHDAFGNPTSAAGVEITVDGRPRPV